MIELLCGDCSNFPATCELAIVITAKKPGVEKPRTMKIPTNGVYCDECADFCVKNTPAENLSGAVIPFTKDDVVERKGGWKPVLELTCLGKVPLGFHASEHEG